MRWGKNCYIIGSGLILEDEPTDNKLTYVSSRTILILYFVSNHIYYSGECINLIIIANNIRLDYDKTNYRRLIA